MFKGQNLQKEEFTIVDSTNLVEYLKKEKQPLSSDCVFKEILFLSKRKKEVVLQIVTTALENIQTDPLIELLNEIQKTKNIQRLVLLYMYMRNSISISSMPSFNIYNVNADIYEFTLFEEIKDTAKNIFSSAKKQVKNAIFDEPSSDEKKALLLDQAADPTTALGACLAEKRPSMLNVTITHGVHGQIKCEAEKYTKRVFDKFLALNNGEFSNMRNILFPVQAATPSTSQNLLSGIISRKIDNGLERTTSLDFVNNSNL